MIILVKTIRNVRRTTKTNCHPFVWEIVTLMVTNNTYFPIPCSWVVPAHTKSRFGHVSFLVQWNFS